MTLQAESGNGFLRARIRPRINWLMLGSSLLILFIVVGAGFIPASERLIAISRSGNSVSGQIARLVVIGAIAIANIRFVLKMLFSSDLVVLNQATLEIQRWLFTLNLSQRNFSNSTVENLRYDKWGGGRAGMQNAIRFESDGETITLARQATESDSWDLIDRMCEVYKFPTKEESTGTARSPAVTEW